MDLSDLSPTSEQVFTALFVFSFFLVLGLIAYYVKTTPPSPPIDPVVAGFEPFARLNFLRRVNTAIEPSIKGKLAVFVKEVDGDVSIYSATHSARILR